MRDHNSWLTIPAPNPAAQIVLVALPFAGGGASVYRDWPTKLPSNVELVSAELPGRESRLNEPPLNDLNAVIAALQAALLPFIGGRHFALFGHSLGALLAFELARALRRDGCNEPLCIFASGREAPTKREPGPDIHHLPDMQFVNAMITRYNGIPKLLLEEPELLQLFLPAMKADLCLTESYNYTAEAPFDCPIHILGGEDDTRLTRDLLRPWAEETTGPAPLRMFAGGHFFIRDSRDAVTSYVRDVLMMMAGMLYNAPL